MEEELQKVEKEFAFQEKWIPILLRGKFLLQEIPDKNIILIAKRVTFDTRRKLVRTCKRVHAVLREFHAKIELPRQSVLSCPYFREINDILKIDETFLLVEDETWITSQNMPILPRKLPEKQANLEIWLVEAQNCLEIRRKWMVLLQRSKFILELIPKNCIKEVIKRTLWKKGFDNFVFVRKPESNPFLFLYSSTKWISQIFDGIRLTFRKNAGCWEIRENIISQDPEYLTKFENYAPYLSFFNFEKIDFISFNKNIPLLMAILYCMSKHKIMVRRVNLRSTPLLKEIFTILKPKILGFNPLKVVRYIPGFDFPEELEEIRVSTLRRSSRTPFMDDLTGHRIKVLWHVWDCSIPQTEQFILDYIQLLCEKQCRSNIQFCLAHFETTVWTDLSIMNLTQNSPTIYLFRGMARGRGGEWKYGVRIQKSNVGGAAMIFYSDTRRQLGTTSAIKYLQTFAEFIEFFESTINRRNQINVMAPMLGDQANDQFTDFDFKAPFSFVLPFIQHNPQTEAQHLEQVRRQFF